MSTNGGPDPLPGDDRTVNEFAVSPGTLGATEVRELLGTERPLVLDIGANFGQTTLDLLLAIPGATVHAFEPDPRAAAKFRRYIEHPRVHLHECAVGARNGTVLFNQSSGLEHPQTRPEGWDQSGSIRRPYKHLNFHPEVRFEKMIEVPIVTLDAWADMHGINHVDFIWADVQGAESDLVQGASRILGSTRYFYTEYSNVEMYEGQVDLATLAAMLPDFAVVRRYQWDVLFRNRRYG